MCSIDGDELTVHGDFIATGCDIHCKDGVCTIYPYDNGHVSVYEEYHDVTYTFTYEFDTEWKLVSVSVDNIFSDTKGDLEDIKLYGRRIDIDVDYLYRHLTRTDNGQYASHNGAMLIVYDDNKWMLEKRM